MSDKKFYKKLPVVQQTTAIKNFFESTVEQLFSKAETESLQGFIGAKRSEDSGVEGKYLVEPTVTKRFYGLSPTVHTVDENTGDSTNLIFFDEFINTLKTYNVNVKDQNKIFGEKFSSFMPPIDVDKMVNYAEYYWSPTGPSTIDVTGTVDMPIDIDRDVLGKPNYITPNGITLRNGMVVQFTGEYVIPVNKTGKEFIVEGVGQGILLLPKAENYSTRFTEISETPYDDFDALNSDLVRHYTGGKIDSISVLNGGIGYVDPEILIYDDSVSEELSSQYPALTTSYLDESGNLREIVAFEQIIESLTTDGSLTEYSTITGIIDGSNGRKGDRATVNTTSNSLGVISAAIDNKGTNYSGTVYIRVYDKKVSTTLDVTSTAQKHTYSGSVFSTDKIDVVDAENIMPGQSIRGTGALEFSCTVKSISGKTVTLDKHIFIDADTPDTAIVLDFKGQGFQPQINMVYTDEDLRDTYTVTATPIANPNNERDYYYVNLENSWDKDLTGDGEGDLSWAGEVRSAPVDYILQQRGAPNRNVWSRVNFWYHRNNFIDAGDDIPGPEFRAQRPIIEFDRYLELYNHGVSLAGVVNVVSTGNISQFDNAEIGTLVDGFPLSGSTIVFLNETSDVNKYIYIANLDLEEEKIKLKRIPDPAKNPKGLTDGDPGFIPLVVTEGQLIQVSGGAQNIGKEFVYTGQSWKLAQEKTGANQPPLFNLYDKDGISLADDTFYPNSSFSGSKLFGYATANSSNSEDVIVGQQPDPVLGFPLVYKQYKSSSEIVFQNYQETEYMYQLSNGGIEMTSGYNYYKLLKDVPEFHSYWKEVDQSYRQRIVTSYEITQLDVDSNRVTFSIGCLPQRNSALNSGYDIVVKVNNEIRTDFVYAKSLPSFIDFDAANFEPGDFIEISAYSSQGVISLDNSSKHEMPIGWGHNVHKQDISDTSEPEYLPHFKSYIENQIGFDGDPLSSNNFTSTAQDVYFADNIVQSNQDIILGAYLLDDQPHNLVDAMRYTASEYIKYKNRLRNEIDNVYTQLDTTDFTTEQLLENVLRRLISFKVGREVFNRTYILPFGDNYASEQQIVGLDQTTFTFSYDSNLDQLENSLLIYKNNELLCVDRCYVITNYSPVTIELQPELTASVGDVITAKLYNDNRDSAQCPPTPSTMGLMPLYQPEIVTDYTFAEPIDVIVGHDGSRTPTQGDRRDELLLNFELRIYNSAKAEFREKNSQLDYNLFEIKPSAFRNTGYGIQEWHDLMRHYYALWTSSNGVDPVVNEFYDPDNSWTWNYRGNNTPGYWKGVYEYYYDTQRPDTHPWEMLGFTEKPLWWESYYGTDYSSNNTQLWEDLEQGIIRQGTRKNTDNNLYMDNNPYRRLGLFKVIPVDSEGNKRSPYELFNTGTTTATTVWQNINSLQHYSYRTESFVNSDGKQYDGLTISVDSHSDSNGNVYVESHGILNHSDKFSTNAEYAEYVKRNGNPIREQHLKYNIPYKNLTHIDVENDITPMIPAGAVGVLVNGLPLYNINRNTSWNNEDEWHYDMARIEPTANPEIVSEKGGLYYYNIITPEVVGLDQWETDKHSPIVGWAFDGLPIYGPYGYIDPNTADALNGENIGKVQSPWTLRSGSRNSGPGGAYTGDFIEDYRLGSAGEGIFTNQYNLRYSKTPDSPDAPIWFYVVTLDENNEPAFPYHVGGGETAELTWAGNYISNPPVTGEISHITVTDKGGLYTNATVIIDGDGVGATATAVISELDSDTNLGGQITEIIIDNPGQGYTYATVTITGDGVRARAEVTISTADNPNNNGFVNSDAEFCFKSTASQKLEVTGNTRAGWIFSDGAPVENAWKSSEGYPFAEAEALLLAKPGRFATVFSDPTKIYRASINTNDLLSTVNNKRWIFTDPEHFSVHGETDSSGNFLTNIGYTQFIHSWMSFQGLDIVDDFVKPMRTLGVKLAHRMSGYIDKDTMSVRTDQYSNDGKATSLIIPKENIDVSIHSSNYISRNFYSGVVIEKTATGYRVKGYDVSSGFFEVLESDTTKRREKVSVGGEPAPFVVWEPNQTYRKGAIVEHLAGYYEAPASISTGQTFDRTLWTRLPSLPQTNSATGVLYKETTGRINRVNYNTEFTTVQEVFDFLISLGRYQEYQGFDFGEFRTDINAVSNWAYSAKQFLFWTTGKWEIGNTIELSPLASRTEFATPRGFIAKINRTDREQFSIVDFEGAVIDPRECEIERTQDRIVITPPDNRQIYGVKLYVKEIDHAIVFDNLTQFNDVIFNDLLFQKHSRIKVKATRTKNWTGKLMSEGFIINGDELLPNLDNMAESMGRYHELGFVPVEKQLYNASRAMYGYSEREYLRELDVLDEEQFDFYRGMLQSKGTQNSLTQIARSSAVVQGNVTVYDEWALRAGDFGDTENHQSVELKLTKSEIVQDPQLVSIVLPEDVTNVIDRIDVINPKFIYNAPPQIEIAQPSLGGIPATAVASLDSDGRLSAITVTSSGQGYNSDTACVNILAANVVTDSRSTTIAKATVNSNALISGSTDLTGVNGVTLGTSAQFTLNDKWNNSGNVEFNLSSNVALTVDDIVNAINNNADVNTNIKAASVTTHLVEGNVSGEYNTLILTGNDFEIANGYDIGLQDGRYQPRQRFQLESPVSVPLSDSAVTLEVKIDNTVLTDNVHYTIRDAVTTEITPVAQLPTPTYNGSDWVLENNENVTFSLTGNLADSSYMPELGALNEEGRYRFVQVYINNVQIFNHVDSYDGNTVTHEGTIFTLTKNSIIFHDISRLPREALDTYFNPPSDVDSSEQRELVFGLSPNTEIKVVELSTFEFEEEFQGDVPGSTLSAKISTKEDIAVRIGRKRLYGVTIDDPNDDIITIDIDDNTRFLKKPIGEVGTSLWPTSNLVDASGFIDNAYNSIPNAGYVHPSDVNFRAFDISSIPDLFNTDNIIKPFKDSLIHVASAENNDWNVYKLNKIQGSISFLNRANDNSVSLYTDFSLFNYLDTNQIGEENTGRYLDYYLTFNNSTLSDNVAIWRNEDIVQSKQFQVNDFKAPKMVEALISSIKPHNLVSIQSVEPEVGKKYGDITITPSETSNIVTVTGNNFTSITGGDLIRLVDNVGTEINYSAGLEITGNVITVNTGYLTGTTILDGGSGYTETPEIIFAPSPTGNEYDRAKGFATISGGLGEVTVVDDGTVRETSIIEITGDGTGAAAEARITNARIVGFQILDAGFGYEANVDTLPTVTITGSGSGATAVITEDDIGPGGEITTIRVDNAGSGYDADNVTVTVSAPADGNAPAVVPVLEGNVTVEVTSPGTGYTQAPEILITGLGIESIDAKLSASVESITITYGGAGYVNPPAITVVGDHDEPANVNASLDKGITELNDKVNESGLGNVYIQLTGEPDANLAFRVSPALTAQEEEMLQSVNTVLNTRYEVKSIDPVNGKFTIQDDAFTSELVANIANRGYSFTLLQDFDDSLYEVYNVSGTSLQIERPDTVETETASFMHLNKTKINTDIPHPYNVGDVIRVYTNTIRGMYTVESVTPTSLVISAPYLPNFESGEIVQKGLEIKLAGDHGISPLYAAQGKRVAVHFVEPLYYNKVYPIGQVTGDTIIVDDYWPKDRQTHTFFETKFGTVNGSVPYEAGNVNADYANATNIIDVTNNVRLNDFVATYNSNSAVVQPSHVTFAGNIAIINPDALPSNTDISVGITINRQQMRESDRYPMLTTLDHNKVNINGAIIEIDNFNNPKAVADSIDRNIRLRESFTDVDREKFNLRIPMLKDYRKPVAEGYSAGEISNYGPYIRDANVILALSDNQLKIEEGTEIVTETATDSVLDDNFVQPNVTVGPTKGLSYVANDVEYIWSPALQRYRPVNIGDVIEYESTDQETHEEVPAPEYHFDSFNADAVRDWVPTSQEDIQAEDNPTANIVYFENDLVKRAGNYYVATNNISMAMNDVFNQDNWDIVTDQSTLEKLYDEYLILKRVPGTATANPLSDQPGLKKRSYNMLQSVVLSGNKMPKYRLGLNNSGLFYVYEAVQNNDGDLYFILVDKAPAPAVPHDYYRTISRYSNFLGYPTTNYYYENGIVPEVDVNNAITNARDPIRLSNNATVVELPPVEPAAYVGAQVIPEPFAVANTSYSGVGNFTALPKIRIASERPGDPAEVTSYEAGYNSFLMWTAGLTSGEWRPTDNGPGALPGLGSQRVGLGLGKGYYSANGEYPEGYPATSNLKYNRPIPRFAYSSNYSVLPESRNYPYPVYVAGVPTDEVDGFVSEYFENSTNTLYGYVINETGDVERQSYRATTVFTESDVDAQLENGQTTIAGVEISDLVLADVKIEYIDSDNDDVNNYGLRPEEIWVACFWTEPHIYPNQLVGWDYNNVDASGLPTPIRADYTGTVVRFKYIRLTELPPGAVTRRPIPDTGWAGKQWDNLRVDDVNLEEVREDEIWDIFDSTEVISGSTGTPSESVSVSVGDVNTTAGSIGQSSGSIPAEIINSIPNENNTVIPTTDVGPVLTGAVLEGLPGPCVPPADPFGEPLPKQSRDCHTKTVKRIKQYISNTSDAYLIQGTDSNDLSYGVIQTKIAGKGDYRVFFDFTSKVTNNLSMAGAGLAIVQSATPYPVGSDDREWWNSETTVQLLDTRTNGSTVANNGSQIGVYGKTPYTVTGESDSPEITSLLGLSTSRVSENHELEFLEPGATRINHLKQNYNDNSRASIGVNGVGFLVKYGLDCSNGEYLTLFVSEAAKTANLPPPDPVPANWNGTKLKDSVIWDIVIDYQTEVRVFDPSDAVAETCENIDAPSRAYQQGATWTEWSSNSTHGYFGQNDGKGELRRSSRLFSKSKRSYMDNIYYPYDRPETVIGWHPDNDVGNRQNIVNKLKHDKHAGHSSVRKSKTRIVRDFNRYRFPGKMRTVELKGYFRAPVTGTYRFGGNCDDGLWLWVSSAFVDAQGGTMNRVGVNEYGIVKCKPENPRNNMELGTQSYFVEDGAPDKELPLNISRRVERANSNSGTITWDSDEYMHSHRYHRDNCVLRTGWRTTGQKNENAIYYGINGSNGLYSAEVHVELQEGEYYFVRAIFGNEAGPGFCEIKYDVIDRGLTNQKLEFGGRWCPSDNPPAGIGDYVPGGDPSVAAENTTTSADRAYLACTDQKQISSQIVGEPTYDQASCYFDAYNQFPPNTPDSIKDAILTTTETIPDFETNAEYIARQVLGGTATPEQTQWYERWLASGNPATADGMMTEEEFAEFLASGGSVPQYTTVESGASAGITYPYFNNGRPVNSTTRTNVNSALTTANNQTSAPQVGAGNTGVQFMPRGTVVSVACETQDTWTAYGSLRKEPINTGRLLYVYADGEGGTYTEAKEDTEGLCPMGLPPTTITIQTGGDSGTGGTTSNGRNTWSI